jgi:hypothetical protein
MQFEVGHLVRLRNPNHVPDRPTCGIITDKLPSPFRSPYQAQWVYRVRWLDMQGRTMNYEAEHLEPLDDTV